MTFFSLGFLQQHAGEKGALFGRKSQHPDLPNDQKAVRDFILANGQRFAEPGWMRYSVFGLL